MNPEQLIKQAKQFRVTEGPFYGRPLQVLPWQQKVFKKLCQNTVLAVSMGRGGGKSTILGVICALGLMGGLSRPRGQVVCTASTLEQSKVVGKHAIQFIKTLEDYDPKDWKISDNITRLQITHVPSRSKLRCISSNVNGMHGLAAHLIVVDELAQIKRADEVLAVMRTTLGKQQNGKMICIGTLPGDQTNPFYQMCHEPDTRNREAAVVFHATKSLSIWSKRAIQQANPSAKHFPVLMQAILRQRDAARKDPALQAGYKSLRLNMGEHLITKSMFIGTDVWQGLLQKDGEKLGVSGPYIMGLDLGGSRSMSAAVAYDLKTGAVDSITAVGDKPGVQQRGRADRVGDLYARAQAAGQLITCPGRVPDIGYLLDKARLRFCGYPEYIVCDRFRKSELLDHLDHLKWYDPQIVFRGQGYKDGSEDIRDSRSLLLAGRASIPPMVLLQAAIRDSVVISDPSGNEKLDKASKSTGARDDVLAAFILALGLAHRLERRQMGVDHLKERPLYTIVGRR